MNRLFFSMCLLLVGFFKCLEGTESFVVQPNSYLLSKRFDLYSNSNYLASVDKNLMQLRCSYTLADEQGEIATGTARLFSLGSLFHSMKEIDIYDNGGRQIGLVEGYFWTTASAKFAFYNEERCLCALAYLDLSSASISIVDAYNEHAVLALFRRTYVPNGTYYWEVKPCKEGGLDPRVLYIFAAFITDAFRPIPPSRGITVWDAIETTIILQDLFEDD